MYRNIDIELTRNDMTRGDLAEKLGVTRTTMSLKLNGKSIITFEEAKKIKSILKTEMTLEDLFEDTSQAS